MTHTPGPWEAKLCRWQDDAPVYGFWIKAGKKRAGVASVAVTQGTAVCGLQPTPEYMKEEFYEPEELQANAALISAAPELLAALARIIEELPTNRDWLDPALETQAREAIAKANGGAE